MNPEIISSITNGQILSLDVYKYHLQRKNDINGNLYGICVKRDTCYGRQLLTMSFQIITSSDLKINVFYCMTQAQHSEETVF
ncbi:hypothetical protein AYI68_g8302 [Smittium mucronatum]|uniref:Uncharacterized protein n=1 Tax=Smittium mucronatum TaxID=133383 RepID=A0A1R0GLA1_9FUNG|nr:hypothetical protein AYI68_g8302 [Smittium mucronatum]